MWNENRGWRCFERTLAIVNQNYAEAERIGGERHLRSAGGDSVAVLLPVMLDYARAR